MHRQHNATKSISLVVLAECISFDRLCSRFEQFRATSNHNIFTIFSRLHSDHLWTIFRRYVPYFYSSLRSIWRPEPQVPSPSMQSNRIDDENDNDVDDDNTELYTSHSFHIWTYTAKRLFCPAHTFTIQFLPFRLLFQPRCVFRLEHRTRQSPHIFSLCTVFHVLFFRNMQHYAVMLTPRRPYSLFFSLTLERPHSHVPFHFHCCCVPKRRNDRFGIILVFFFEYYSLSALVRVHI